MGGGLEADLSHRIVGTLWRCPQTRWRPVLQVADVRHVPDGSGLSPAPEQWYSLTLSDGVHSQPGKLAASLNHLARDGALCRGSVVRLLDFVRDDYHRRTIIVTQLQILQTECPLIGSLKPYEPTRKSGGFITRSIRHVLRPEPGCEPYRGGQHNHQSCIASEAEGSANGLSYHSPRRGSSIPGGDTLYPVGLLAEPAVWKTVRQIKDEYLGYSDVPDFITVKAFISFIKAERLCSAAYPMVVNGKVCNVKAAGSDDGMWPNKRSGQSFGSCYYGTWHLKRCGHSSYSCDCEYSCGQRFDSCDCGYSVRIQIQDYTGATFATMYDKAAKEIFGYTAKELYLMWSEEQDCAQLRGIKLGIEYKQYVLQLKVEAKPFSGGRQVECVVLKAEKVNPSAESRRLLGRLTHFWGRV
ncbi:hypothetical protein HU200_020183 [Digitaria exilis]|uniref:Replication protein A 70 kDa DNA-binding subunit n=1 Tax=Digitaria exilis TaxID=1010633 RepID=A0A835F1H6_9POAL|nr:hypothetical protein HU200_020183 [Digitaria exilis]